MAWAFIIGIACFFTTLIAPVSRTIAVLNDGLGQSVKLPIAAISGGALTAVIASFLGALAGNSLEGLPQTGLPQTYLIAAAWLFAAVQIFRKHAPLRTPAEPTRSLGAIALVLTARQIFDAARIIGFAASAMLVADWRAIAGAVILGSTLAIILPRAAEITRLLSQITHSLRWVLAVLCVAAAGYSVITYSCAISAG